MAEELKINKIKIGSLIYDFKFKKKLIDDDNKKLFGHILYDKQEIEVENNITEDRKKLVTLHECIHGMDDYYQFNLSEKDIDYLSGILMNFINDNKKLMEFIIK